MAHAPMLWHMHLSRRAFRALRAVMRSSQTAAEQTALSPAELSPEPSNLPEARGTEQASALPLLVPRPLGRIGRPTTLPCRGVHLVHILAAGLRASTHERLRWATGLCMHCADMKMKMN